MDGEMDELLVWVKTNENYKKAMEKRKGWLLELKNLPICLEMEKIWEDLASNGISGVGDGVTIAGDQAGKKEGGSQARQ